MGTLKILEENTAEMVIGDQLLRGTMVALKKPLLLTEKTKDGVVVIGAIRTKVIFSARPEHTLR